MIIFNFRFLLIININNLLLFFQFEIDIKYNNFKIYLFFYYTNLNIIFTKKFILK